MRERPAERVRVSHKIGRVVEEDHPARTEHRARCRHRLEIIREIEVFFKQTCRGSAARLRRDDPSTLARTAGYLQKGAQRSTQMHFIVPGLSDMTADRNDF